MKLKVLLLTMVMTMMVGIGVYADPTVNGATGLIEVPSAGALRYKEWNCGLTFQNNEGNTRPGLKYVANLGTFKGLELGFVGNDLQEGVFINAKFYLMNDNSKNPLGLALGFQNLSSFSESTVYMVASKKFKQNFNMHLGFTADLKDKIKAYLMSGIEVYMMNNSMSFIADIKGTEDTWRFNSGFRFYMMNNLTLTIAVLDILDSENTGKGSRAVAMLSWNDFL